MRARGRPAKRSGASAPTPSSAWRSPTSLPSRSSHHGGDPHKAGVTNIETSAQAAEALKPIAGEFAFIVFALGIVGTGLFAIPVLAGSAAYAIGEACKWPVGFSRKPNKAAAFYWALAASAVLGMAITLTPIDPIKALYWSAVINGVVAVPVMTVMMLWRRSHGSWGNSLSLAGCDGWAGRQRWRWPPALSA